MLLRPHGGNCCGINHIFFVGETARQDNAHTQLREIYRRVNSGMAVEVVLTDTQLRQKPWLGPLLAKLGFRHFKEGRFRNPNSGNICNIFYFSPAFTRAEIPFSFNPDDCHLRDALPTDIPVGTVVESVHPRTYGHRYRVEGSGGYLAGHLRVRPIDGGWLRRMSSRSLRIIED